MIGKEENSLYRILLKYLNIGKKVFEAVEIVTESNGAVFVQADLVTQMLEDKILKKVSENRYEIIADIGAFRNYLLRKTTEENEIVGSRGRAVPIDIILNSSWEAVVKSDSEKHVPKFVKQLRGEFKDDHKFEWSLLKDDDSDKDGDDDEDMEDDEDAKDDEDDDEDEDGNGISDEYKDNEEIYRQVLKFCIEYGIASVSLIQRHFPIGYIMSCKIIDWMEDNDFISSQIGSKPRRVLIDRNDYENIFDISFDKHEAEIKKSGGDSALISFLKRRASEQDRKNAAQNLINALSRVAEKKSVPVTCEDAPGWSLWNYNEFEEAVIERLERIIKSDRRMGRQGAIKKAETYLEAVRDTHDGKMVQVYERIVYEFKAASNYIYNLLRNQLFDKGGE